MLKLTILRALRGFLLSHRYQFISVIDRAATFSIYRIRTFGDSLVIILKLLFKLQFVIYLLKNVLRIPFLNGILGQVRSRSLVGRLA